MGVLFYEPTGTDDDKTSRLAHRRKICEFEASSTQAALLTPCCRVKMGRMHAPGKGICTFSVRLCKMAKWSSDLELA